jgi:hypothetical protein
MTTMTMTLVGKGDVVVFSLPAQEDNPPVHVALSDEVFVQGLKALIEQARHHPTSLLRKLKVEDGGH